MNEDHKEKIEEDRGEVGGKWKKRWTEMQEII